MGKRRQPNIAFAGTPGAGKSRLCARLAQADTAGTHTNDSDTQTDTKTEDSALTVIDCGQEAARLGCRDSWDAELKSWVIDEDKLAKKLRARLGQGGCLLDWIHADFWPHGAIDLVVHVRATNTALYDRYQAREYSAAKIEQNLDSEIMDYIGGELHEYFVEMPQQDGEEPIELLTLQSNSEEEADANLKTLREWLAAWRARRDDAQDDDDDDDDDDGEA